MINRPGTAPLKRAMSCTREGTFVPLVNNADVVAVTRHLNTLSTTVHSVGTGRGVKIELLPLESDLSAIRSAGINADENESVSVAALSSPIHNHQTGRDGDSISFRANRKQTHQFHGSPVTGKFYTGNVDVRVQKGRAELAEDAARKHSFVPVPVVRQEVRSPREDPATIDLLSDPTASHLSREAVRRRAKEANWLVFWGDVQRLGGEVASMIEKLSLSEADRSRLKSEVEWLTERLSRANEDFKDMQLAMVSDEERHRNMILIEKDRYTSLKDGLSRLQAQVSEMRRKVTTAQSAVAASESNLEAQVLLEKELRRTMLAMADSHAVELMAQQRSFETQLAAKEERCKQLEFLEADHTALQLRVREQHTLIERLQKEAAMPTPAGENAALGELRPSTSAQKTLVSGASSRLSGGKRPIGSQSPSKGAFRFESAGAVDDDMKTQEKLSPNHHALQARFRSVTQFQAASFERSLMLAHDFDADGCQRGAARVGTEKATGFGPSPLSPDSVSGVVPSWLSVPLPFSSPVLESKQRASLPESPLRPIHDVIHDTLLLTHIPKGARALGSVIDLLWNVIVTQSVPAREKSRRSLEQQELYARVEALLSEASAAWREASKCYAQQFEALVAADRHIKEMLLAKEKDTATVACQQQPLANSEAPPLTTPSPPLPRGAEESMALLVRLASAKLDDLMAMSMVDLSVAHSPAAKPPSTPADVFPSYTHNKETLRTKADVKRRDQLALSLAQSVRRVEDFCNSVKRSEHRAIVKPSTGIVGDSSCRPEGEEIALLKSKCDRLERALKEMSTEEKSAGENQQQPLSDQRADEHRSFPSHLSTPLAENNIMAKPDVIHIGMQCTLLQSCAQSRTVHDRLHNASVRRDQKSDSPASHRAADEQNASPLATSKEEASSLATPHASTNRSLPATGSRSHRSRSEAATSAGVAVTTSAMARFHVTNNTGQDDALYYQLQWMQRNGGVQRHLQSRGGGGGGGGGGGFVGMRPIQGRSVLKAGVGEHSRPPPLKHAPSVAASSPQIDTSFFQLKGLK